MPSDEQEAQSESPLSGEIKALLDETYTFNTGSSVRYSGDGTWIESHLIFALIKAEDKAVAASKASAALENRDRRPDPLFSYDDKDTYNLLAALDSIPLTIQDTPWEQADPIRKVSSIEDEPVTHLMEVSPFGDNEVGVFTEWGGTIESTAELKSELGSFSEQGWLFAGIALAPLGAGDGNEEYIGNTYEVSCPDCERVRQAECINVTHDHDGGMDVGVWICQDCDTDFRGTHPRGPAKLPDKDPRP